MIKKEEELEKQKKKYKKEMLKCLKKVMITLGIYSLIVTSPMPKGGLSIAKKQKIKEEVKNNDSAKLISTVMEYVPEEFQYELKSFWQDNIENLTTEEICTILKNARYYSQGKMKNKDVYEMAINYLGYGAKRKTATLSLYIIQNFIEEDDIVKRALLEPEKLSSELTEKYGDGFFVKLLIWVNSINTHHRSFDILASDLDLPDIYPANDIEKILLKPYSYEKYSTSLNETEDIHYEYNCYLNDRKQNKYYISVYDKYFSGKTYTVPNTKTPYELVEKKIKEAGKNEIISLLQQRQVFDGTFHTKEKMTGYRDYDTLTLDLLSMIDSEAVTFKANETYEEYFERLERRFPTLDIYRFNSLLVDMEGKYDYNIYKTFMPLYLEMLAQKETITEDDIMNYTEIYMIFYRESLWQISDGFEEVVSCYLNPLKERFDKELKNILQAKNEENLISLINNTLSYKLKLF